MIVFTIIGLVVAGVSVVCWLWFSLTYPKKYRDSVDERLLALEDFKTEIKSRM